MSIRSVAIAYSSRDVLLLFGTYSHQKANTITDSELSLLTSWTKKRQKLIIKTDHQFNTVFIIRIEKSNNHKRWYYFAAQWHFGNVLRCNTIFCDFCCFLRMIKKLDPYTEAWWSVFIINIKYWQRCRWSRPITNSVQLFVSWAKGFTTSALQSGLGVRRLFGPMKKMLDEQKFASDTEIQSVVRQWLGQQPASFSASGIQKLVDRWDKCLNELGRYVEQALS